MSNDTIGPVGGKTITFLERPAENHGRRIVLEVEATPFGIAEHTHPQNEETLDVLEGQVHVLHGATRKILEPGESMTVPPRTRHAWWNETNGTVRVRVTLTPDGGLEAYLRNVYGLVRDGHTRADGSLKTLQRAVMTDSYRHMLFEPIDFKLRALHRTLAPIGRLLGYRADYPQYRGPSNTPHIPENPE